MSSYASRRAAEQMTQDGIKRNPTWTKPKRVGCASIQRPIPLPKCEHRTDALLLCGKKAGYSTPIGNRCFTHAIAYRDDLAAARAAIAKATEPTPC